MENNEERREKAINALSKDPFRIVKSNPIINSKYEISAVQAKIYLLMISKLDVSKPNFEPLNFSVKDFERLYGTDTKAIYKLISTEAVKLMSKRISYEDEHIRIDTVLLASCIYHKREGRVTFELPRALQPFLLQLKQNFTTYNLENILRLESVYSIRFFEFCKEYEGLGKFSFLVEDLKDTFGIADRYKNYFDFKKYVVLQAEKELKENCELFFDFTEEKQGKKVIKLHFRIHKNRKQKKDGFDFDEAEVIDSPVEEIFGLVRNFVSLETVQGWFAKLPEEQIRIGVNYSLEQNKAGKVKDMGAYLQKLVNETSLWEKESKKQQATKDRKSKTDAHKKVAQQELFKERQAESDKNEFLSDYEQVIKVFSLTKLNTIENLSDEVMESIRSEQGMIMNSIALSSYENNTELSAKDEFFFNYEKGTTFYYVVNSYIQQKYSGEFKLVKQPFELKAKALKISLP